MADLKAKPPRTPSPWQPFVHPTLSKTLHVFVQWDALHEPLQHPYGGPYKVLKRTDKFFTLDINGTHDTVSVDCLKPVYFKCLAPTPSSPPTTTVVSLSSPPTPICTTCSGRHVRFLKDLTYNNMKYSFMFSLYSFSHALFHTCYVHSYTHSLFNHSFLISFIQAFFCLLFIFVCLFCLPPFWGGGEYCGMPCASTHAQ